MKHLFIFHKDSLLLTSRNRIPEGEWTQWLTEEPEETLALPASENGDSNTAAEVTQTEDTASDAKWISLRESFYVLPAADFRLAAKAHELLHWHRASRFCGFCGVPMEWSTEISKRCPECHREVWANVQPAMIVAITRNDGEELLLVQSKNFKRDYLGLVAGFVETGENLEDCVEREIKEETGLTVKNVQYFASQSWPFPNVLMVGFTAEYESGELTLQRSELNKGGWFRRDNLPAIPGKVSLARKLIDHWLEQKKTTHE